MSQDAQHMQVGAVFAHRFDCPAEARALFDVIGNPTVVDTARGRGLHFDGANDYIDIPVALSSGTYSVLMLIETDPATGSKRYPLDSRFGGGVGSIQISAADVFLGSSGTEYVGGVASSSPVDTLTWYGVTGISLTGTKVLISAAFDGSLKMSGTIVSLIIHPGTLSAADVAAISNDTIWAYRSNLVHRWRMASNNPRDDIGSAHGTDVGSPVLVRTGAGYGLRLDGANDAVDVGDLALSETTDYTMLATVRTTWQSAAYVVGGRTATIGSLGMLIRTGAGVAATIGTTTQGGGNTPVADGNRHVVGMVYQGDRVDYYLDGEPDGADISLNGTWTSAVVTKIGARTNGAGIEGEFLGPIDDVSIYAAALTPLQMKHAAWEMTHA